MSLPISLLINAVDALNLFNASNLDTVAVFDSNFNQVFQDARPMRVRVDPKVKAMEHPLETGQIISDYKINLPILATLPIVVDARHYRDVYAEIYNLMNDAELLMVQTRAANFNNMIIIGMPDEERGDMFDVITIEIQLKQVQIVQASSDFSPDDPTQADTQNSGQQNSTVGTLPANSTTNNPQVIRSQFELGGAW